MTGPPVCPVLLPILSSSSGCRRDSSMKVPLGGGCLCGAVRYQITRKPVFVYACHCSDCQGSTGSAFSVGVIVQSDGFEATGHDKTHLIFGGVAASNGRVKQRRVCMNCGTWLYGEPRGSARFEGLVRIVRSGTFDDQRGITPAAHYWFNRAQPWIVLPDGVPRYDFQPDYSLFEAASGSRP
jgi:hypothetical protein